MTDNHHAQPLRKKYSYHKFWKGLNQDPKDSRGRYNDNYVVSKGWYEYFISLFGLPIIAAPFPILYLLLQLPAEMLNDKSGIGTGILLVSLGTWWIVGFWKVLPAVLKKYGIIVYAPKGVPLT